MLIDVALALALYIAAVVPPAAPPCSRRTLLLATLANWVAFAVWNIVLAAYVFPYFAARSEGEAAVESVRAEAEAHCESPLFVYSTVLTLGFVAILILVPVGALVFCVYRVWRAAQYSQEESRRVKEAGVIRG